MQFKNTEIEDAVITAMHDEDLHTYGSIAKEIDEDGTKVFDTLKELCRRGIVFRDEVTKEYHLVDKAQKAAPEEDVVLELDEARPTPVVKPEPVKPKRKHRGPYMSISKKKVDYAKIEECAALGFTHDETADALGIPQNTYYSYRRGDTALAENINAAHKKGQRRAMRQEDAELGTIADTETDTPASVTPCSIAKQNGAARVGASEAVETVEGLKTQKEVEEPIPFQVSKPTEQPAPVGVNIHRAGSDLSRWPCGDAARARFVQHSVLYSSAHPPIASEHVNMPNGMVLIVVHGDLFGASKLERDFIEGLIEVVDAFKRRRL